MANCQPTDAGGNSRACGGSATPGARSRSPFPLRFFGSLLSSLSLCGLGLRFRESVDEGGHAAGACPSGVSLRPLARASESPRLPCPLAATTSFSEHKDSALTPCSGCPSPRGTLLPVPPPPARAQGPARLSQCAWHRAWRTRTSSACWMSKCTLPPARTRAHATSYSLHRDFYLESVHVQTKRSGTFLYVCSPLVPSASLRPLSGPLASTERRHLA